jgi:polyisoprenoid-binding protein YceI
MLRNLRIAAVIVIIIAAISTGAFLYLTRDVAAPSEAVVDSAQQLETSDTSGNQTVFRISQDNSQVKYNIYEQLNGNDKTVVGSTTQVAGDILLNLNDLAQSQIGEISINARTFATDDDRRDNSVARFILQSESDANEFITFKATRINGLSSSAKVGEPLTFQVTGDLTIAGVTQSVTFNVSATLTSANQLTGHAEATVQRSAFSLSIPNVAFVANVGNDVTLKLDFVANAVSNNAA